MMFICSFIYFYSVSHFIYSEDITSLPIQLIKIKMASIHIVHTMCQEFLQALYMLLSHLTFIMTLSETNVRFRRVESFSQGHVSSMLQRQDTEWSPLLCIWPCVVRDLCLLLIRLVCHLILKLGYSPYQLFSSVGTVFSGIPFKTTCSFCTYLQLLTFKNTFKISKFLICPKWDVIFLLNWKEQLSSLIKFLDAPLSFPVKNMLLSRNSTGIYNQDYCEW